MEWTLKSIKNQKILSISPKGNLATTHKKNTC